MTAPETGGTPGRAPRSTSRPRRRSRSRSPDHARRNRAAGNHKTMRSVETAPSRGTGRHGDRDADDEPHIEHGEGGDDDMEAQMQAMMGFGGFGTTKQKKIPGNDVSGVRKEKKTEYRQYMWVLAQILPKGAELTWPGIALEGSTDR